MRSLHDPTRAGSDSVYAPTHPVTGSTLSIDTQDYKKGSITIDDPRLAGPATPVHTRGEREALARKGIWGVINWRVVFTLKTYLRKDWIGYYLVFLLIVVTTVLVSVFHTKIVEVLKPATSTLITIPAGWTIPIAILFIISFPPLFGHEIVAILVGLTWGLWIGFGIVAAGTVLGEVGNFYAFRYCCHGQGRKAEKGSIFYAMLIRVIRDGGFTIALAARLSIIPGHLTTAIFATCGMPILVFILAAILSMPKQFITVYLGVILEEASKNNDQATKTRNGYISGGVFAATGLVTIFAAWYILYRMNQVKETVIYDRRKARQPAIVVDLNPYGQKAHELARSDMPYDTASKLEKEHAIRRQTDEKEDIGHVYDITLDDVEGYPQVHRNSHSDEHLPSRGQMQRPPGLPAPF